ncbi:MAG: ethanolamine utilization protein EutJ [Caldilineales bacterium]|nr:ethanolamine utilization protein EutJ [Caldilineales bacterium]
MNPDLHRLLAAADAAVHTPDGRGYHGPLRVGVDLGTAYTVLFVLDQAGAPLAGAYEFAQVVRDGVVLDFAGATALVRKLKRQVEEHLGRELTAAATAYPPGVPLAEVRATRYVLEAAGLECSAQVDEPTAANAVLQVENGAVVDVGGGTTGIAVIQEGRVVYTADEATGGTHFTLVIAGAHRIPFEQAEALKLDPQAQPRLFPVVRPVMEKVGAIIARHIARFPVETLYLVGGTCAFPGIAGVITEVTGVPAIVPGNPLFVTPLGIALSGIGY